MEWIVKILVLLSCTALFADNSENYRIHEVNGGLELITPYGKKVIMGDYAPDGGFNYHIEIPMNEIKPITTPTPTPQAPTVIQAIVPQTPPQPPTENTCVKKPEEKEEKREPAAILPPKITIEYDETDRMVLEANRLFNKKKFYESTQVVEEILRRKPDYARAWVMKGSLMYKQKQPDLAQKAWQQALVLEPNNAQVKSLLEKVK